MMSMRDPDRIRPILHLVEQIWEQNPDLRLGQLLINAIRPSEAVPEVFYAEDDELVQGLRRLAESLRQPDDDQTGQHPTN
jgi:uncharacterized protein YihD (DUF1040 family)